MMFKEKSGGSKKQTCRRRLLSIIKSGALPGQKIILIVGVYAGDARQVAKHQIADIPETRGIRLRTDEEFLFHDAKPN
jgi:hypothetical protein